MYTTEVKIRTSDKQSASWREAARRAGKTLSAWLRDVADAATAEK